MTPILPDIKVVPDDKREICGVCGGSGQGATEDIKCRKCGGLGEIFYPDTDEN